MTSYCDAALNDTVERTFQYKFKYSEGRFLLNKYHK